MIVRKLCMRQSRQLLALSRRAPVSSRFQSTLPETPVETVQALPRDEISRPENPLFEMVQAQSEASTPAQQEITSNASHKSKFNKLGTTVKALYDPENVIRNPPKPSQVSLEMLLAAGTHLGHSTSRWNPQNSRYIFGIREGVHVISLDVTAAHLRRAAKVVEEVAARGGLILFAGTRKGQKRAVVKAASLAKGYHIFERWIPGSLTNGEQILGHCETKVVNALDEELPNFKADLADRPSLKPDLVVCLNPLENVVLLHECGLNNVPTIGVIDTDADPTRVTYPIPSNDDSLRATCLIAGVLGRAGEAGQLRRLKMAEEGQTTYKPITAAELRLDPFTGQPPGGEGQKK
ncbi:Ribosomal protein S2 bacteria/mitochondria/plastid [Penicillium paradoxum]|uniref:Ribosomal protein S2 bacteria/mitochondria/plastid n=1 Tax=Penicillium paradoxum TaxID=176176 RepID=UPI00254978A6|nr:Ribosomal protein S2 bacteria/mitochondria/plastid [Penicillium paradoxum]KAJ5774482.1 Ribosomal protein S2 bacteria/mitochondria/plastid [Penicillium paradoxum]